MTTKKIASYLLFFLMIPFLSLGQKMSQDEYAKMVDYFNCEVTHYYVSILTSDSVDVKNYLKIQNKLASNTLSDPLSYADLMRLMKDGFAKTSEAISSNIELNKEAYVDGSKESQIKAACSLANLNEANQKALSTKAAELRGELLANSQNAGGDKKISSLETRVFILTCLVAILFFVLIFVLFVFYQSKVSLKSLISGAVFENSPTNDQAKLDLAIQADFEKKLESLQAVCRTLSDDQQRFEQQLELLTEIQEVPQSNDQQVYENIDPIPLVDDVQHHYFFMGSPGLDGTFHMVGASAAFKPGISLYRFEVKSPDATEAEFCFYSDASGIDASLGFPQTYLDPACDTPDLVGLTQVTAIETAQNGHAEKRGEVWFVTQKAQLFIVD